MLFGCDRKAQDSVDSILLNASVAMASSESEALSQCVNERTGRTTITEPRRSRGRAHIGGNLRFYAADTEVVLHPDVMHMIEFALRSDACQLGDYSLQWKGLPIGNAMSEPLAAVITGG